MKTYANYTTLDAIGDMFVIYGIVIVVSLLVAATIRGIVWVLSQQAAREEAKAPKAAPPVAAAPQVSGIPEHHLAVIAATVTMMMGAHRIVRIQTPGRGYSWIAEGRSVHHTSHAPRGGSH